MSKTIKIDMVFKIIQMVGIVLKQKEKQRLFDALEIEARKEEKNGEKNGEKKN